MSKLEKIKGLIDLGFTNEQILKEVDVKERYIKSTRTKMANAAKIEEPEVKETEAVSDPVTEALNEVVDVDVSNEETIDADTTKLKEEEEAKAALEIVKEAMLSAKQCRNCNKFCDECECDECDCADIKSDKDDKEVDEVEEPLATPPDPKYNRIELAIKNLREREKHSAGMRTRPFTDVISRWVACDKAGNIPRRMRQDIELQYNRFLPRPTNSNQWKLAYIAFDEFKKISK